MKQFSILLFFLFVASSTISVVNAQNIIDQKPSASKKVSSQNLKTIQDQFYEYWESHEQNAKENDEVDGENEADGPYNQFKRWEYLMKSRTFPTGNLPDPSITAVEQSKYNAAHPLSATLRTPTWQQTGINMVPTDGGGAGRINVIRFDPISSSTIYIGGAGGGIWRTTDGGTTWAAIGDQLPVTSIADIAINPLDNSTIYAATGDGYGYEATWQTDSDFWGGVYAAGIMKTTDGGATWAPTGLSFEQDNLQIVQRMLIHPVNPDILIAATRNGIYRTTDGGNTWSIVETKHCYDMAFNTANPDIIYAAGNQDILQSTDAGATWTILKDNLGGEGRISIETTPANSNVIYALFEASTKFFKSSDGGVTWVAKQSPSASFYGYYDMALALSPLNEDLLLAGGLSVVKSENGGTSWQSISDYNFPAPDYVHADNHALAFSPTEEGAIYACNDGGIFKSVNLGQTWSDLSTGLSIAQIYRLSSSLTNPDIISSGWQDNGCNLWNGSSWKHIYGADGMETIVDYTDADIIYESTQYGGVSKSLDGGLSWQNASPSGGGNWVTPYVMDPLDHNILYYGGTAVYKTTNGGSNWTNTGNIFSGEGCNAITVAPSNTSYVYAASLDAMYVTANGGSTWTDITQGLPVSSAGMNYIAVSNADPLQVWVVFSGYEPGEKVYHSTDGGANWTNVSGTLPNVPVNTIVYENDSPDGLYIGTDIGVFYLDNTLSDWVSYNAGLPNVMIHELEINYTSSQLVAATYGRGIWQSNLYYTIQYANDMGAISVIVPSNEVCSNAIDPVIKVKNFGSTAVTSFNVNYSIDGGLPQIFNWSGTLAPLASETITLPALTGIAVGPHTFSVFTSDPNGIGDNNAANDQATSTFTVVPVGTSLPFEEGFESGVFPPANWTLENLNELWSAYNGAGAYGNSSTSAMADFYHIGASSDYLITPFLDFTGAVPPVKIKFSVAYAKKNLNKTDTLKVAVSTDCGATYADVYVSGGAALATAPDLAGSAFVPTNSQWKDEIVDLSAFESYDRVLVRFEAKSDHGNDLYLDDINIYGLATGISPDINDGNISIYPNPAHGDFTLSLNGPVTGKVTIEIYNVVGQVIPLTEFEKPAGGDTYALHFSIKEKGLFLVKVKAGNKVFSQSLLIE